MPSHNKHRHHADPHHPHLPDHAIDVGAAVDGDRDHPSPGHSLESDHSVDADDEHLRERTVEHHHNHEMSKEEKISNLMQLNDALVKQVASSRAAKEELSGKVEGIEEELQKVVGRADALLVENNWMADEKRKLELEVTSFRKEVAGIGSEKASLSAEKQDLLESKLELENSLSKSRADLNDIREQLHEAGRAEALAQENAEKLKSEVEQFLLDKRGLTREIDALQARNASVEGDLKLLRERETFLEEELSNVRNAYAAAEGQVVDAKTEIEALQVEASRRTEEKDRLEKQLKEAWQRVESLEAQQKAGIAKHNEMESQIENLENDLFAIRNAHDSASLVLEQEKKAKGSLNDLLASAHAKSRGLEGHLDSLKSSLVKLQDDTNRDQQRISSLESEVSSLGSEKALLEESKISLENKVRMLNSASAKASVASKTEVEKLAAVVRDLERALADAMEKVSQRGKNVCQLEIDLNELKSFFEEKSRLARLAWSVAAVSTGALAVMGISTVLRRSK